MTKREKRVRWTRLVAGFLLLIAVSTSAAGATEADQYLDTWAADGSLLLGLLLVVSVLLTTPAPAPAPAKSMWGAKERRLPSGNGQPLLGELLVYKYDLITEAQLAKALARQRETSQKIGEVLIEMGLVTPAQIAIALADQQSKGDPFGLASDSAEPGPELRATLTRDR